MKNYAEVHRRADEILNNATASQRQELLSDRNYGAPYSFWSSAVHYGLATQEELEQARDYYGDIWYYRGD